MVFSRCMVYIHPGHACSKITITIQRKVHFLYAKNLPAELPGYGLGAVLVGRIVSTRIISRAGGAPPPPPPPQLEHWGGIAPPNFRLQYIGVPKSPLLSVTVYTG